MHFMLDDMANPNDPYKLQDVLWEHTLFYANLTDKNKLQQ